jgi:hypothetical protein
VPGWPDNGVFRSYTGLEDFFRFRKDSMVLIKVRYDAYNRQFKVMDRELVHILEDGETYVVMADVSVGDLKPSTDAEVLPEIFATA